MEHNDYGRSVAERVSTAIEKSGYSLRDVADLSGVPLATLSRKKNGHSPFDVAELYRIAGALEIPTASLFADVA